MNQITMKKLAHSQDGSFRASKGLGPSGSCSICPVSNPVIPQILQSVFFSTSPLAVSSLVEMF